MKRLCTLFLLLLLFGFQVIAEDDDEKKNGDDPGFRVAGYLPDYRFYINVNNTATHLTDLFLFSIGPNVKAATGFDSYLQQDHYETARQARAHSNDKLKLWITLGGAGRSAGFKDCFVTPNDEMVAAIAKIAGFIKALTNIAQKEQVQGIIFDCEQFATQHEFNGYLQLMKKVIPAMQRNNISVAIAVHVQQFLAPDLYKQADYIHLMAYDLQGVGFHADLQRVQEGVFGLMQSGCPAEKILLGIPAYGRKESNFGDVKTFAEIVDGQGGKEEASPATNLWNGYRYESSLGVQKKIQYAKSKGLGGVFFWEIGQDKQTEAASGGILVEAAARSAGLSSGSKAASAKDEL